MAYSESAYEAAKKYKKENIKRVPLDMQISDYEALKVAATACNEKVNEYIKKAIRERMRRERDEGHDLGTGNGGGDGSGLSNV